MASTRQAERETTQVARDALRNAEEETARTASTAGNAAVDVARTGADLMQRNMEAAQQAWEASSQMARQFVERSMGQFASTAAQGGTTTRGASQGFEGMLDSATALASGMQQLSREWLDFSQRTLQKSVDNLDALAKCRNGPEMLALQTDIVRDHFAHVVESSRRMAELLTKTAERTVRKQSGTTTSP